jgi:hypothetical protein
MNMLGEGRQNKQSEPRAPHLERETRQARGWFYLYFVVLPFGTLVGLLLEDLWMGVTAAVGLMLFLERALLA